MPLIRPLPYLKLLVALLVLASLWTPARAADVVKLTGAGASFPAPLYQRWFRDYYLAHPDVRVDYQAIGSGGGIENFIGGRLDFAGSDLQLSDEGVGKVEGGVVQIPVTAGAVVIAYNLPGIDSLKLTREALASVFLGKVERWNDPIIAAANPGLELPDMPMTLVARADSSGTTLAITRHLSAISTEFADTIGTTMTPVWPKALKQRGALIRGQANSGVAAYVKTVRGALGYVQYAYAHLTNLPMASLENKAGNSVTPGSDSFEAAVKQLKSELDLVHEADPKGPQSYPILSLSWLILRKDYEDPKAAALKDLLRYVLTQGQQVAHLIGYIPLSRKTVDRLLQSVDKIE
jgi:phosphate transport system substrate-binding protein